MFLRRGHTDVTSPAGRKLIAHELTHVVQQAGGQPVIQRELYEVEPGRVYDDQLDMTATEKSGFVDIFVGDTDGLDYEIGTATNGERTLVPSTAGFAVSSAPSGFVLGGTSGSGGTGVTGVSGASGGPPATSTVSASGGKATFKPAPAWAPDPRSPYYRSPKGKTILSASPGGTQYKQGPKTHTSKQKPRRGLGGFQNPGQFEYQMLPLWRAAAQSPIPATVTNDDELIDWLKDPARHFQVWNSTRTQSKIIQDYRQPGKTKSAVVLGHDPSASTVWNAGAHQLPRYTNYQHNQLLSAYHGLEDWRWSAQSGRTEPKYLSPRPDLGSHPGYFDPNHPDFGGASWHTYNRMSPLEMITYIEGKLAGAPSSAAKDDEFRRARMELAMLKVGYSQSRADDLLGLIKKKGW